MLLYLVVTTVREATIMIAILLMSKLIGMLNNLTPSHTTGQRLS